jgi:hypothetical protein
LALHVRSRGGRIGDGYRSEAGGTHQERGRQQDAPCVANWLGHHPYPRNAEVKCAEKVLDPNVLA